MLSKGDEWPLCGERNYHTRGRSWPVEPMATAVTANESSRPVSACRDRQLWADRCVVFGSRIVERAHYGSRLARDNHCHICGAETDFATAANRL
jgi:hypothetical protein